MKTLNDIQNYYGSQLAKAALELGAIRLSVNDPFRWASGYRMPIYNDNRQFLLSVMLSLIWSSPSHSKSIT